MGGATQQPIGRHDPTTLAGAKENQYFDRKSTRIKPNDVARHIVAFANAAGGKLAIDIEDNGEITGFSVERAQNVEDFGQAALAFCSSVPNVRKERVPVVTASGKDDFILVLDVEESTDRAITRRGDRKVFLRQRDRSVELDRE